MTDTPRTDAKEQCGFVYDSNGEPVGNGIPAVSADFARTLERELAEANEKVRQLEAQLTPQAANVVSLPCAAPHIEKLAEDFGDVETLFNSRQWLEKAITEHGATITDAGMGMGGADLGFTLEGCPFDVRIRPRLPAKDRR